MKKQFIYVIVADKSIGKLTVTPVASHTGKGKGRGGICASSLSYDHHR